jgi:hypothetical protein
VTTGRRSGIAVPRALETVFEAAVPGGKLHRVTLTWVNGAITISSFADLAGVSCGCLCGSGHARREMYAMLGRRGTGSMHVPQKALYGKSGGCVNAQALAGFATRRSYLLGVRRG